MRSLHNSVRVTLTKAGHDEHTCIALRCGTEPPAVPLSPAGKAIAHIMSRGGVRFNGDRTWDLQVHHPRFYRRLLKEGNLGAGESYVDGWGDAAALDEFFCRVHRADLQGCVGCAVTLLHAVKSRFINLQTESRARKVARAHYDLGNEIYQAMLDRSMRQPKQKYDPAGVLLDLYTKCVGRR